MKIVRARAEDAAALSAIAFSPKRHWHYPERWIEAWRDTLTVQADFVNGNETYAAVVDGRKVGFYALCVAGDGLRVFALGLGQTLPKTTASRLATTLLLLAGLAMVGLAFTTDATNQANRATWHGIIHDLSFAGLGFTLFPSMLAFGWAFRRSSDWRGLSTYTWLTAALAVPTFAVKGVAFYLFLVAVFVWTAKVAWRLKTKVDQSSNLSLHP